MKRCTNPQCPNPAVLFRQTQECCPFCQSTLVDTAQVPSSQVLPSFLQHPLLSPGNIPFITSRQGVVTDNNEFHGRVSSIESAQIFTSPKQKLWHSLVAGEPYQISAQSVENELRLEEITPNGISTQTKSITLYGNYLGQIKVGDELIVKSKPRRQREVAKKVFNVTTQSTLRPGLQISGGFLWVALLVVGSIALVCLPFVLVGVVLYWVIRDLFFKRRRW